MFYWDICAEPLHLLYDKEFAVVIYNTKIMPVINGKDVSSNRDPWHTWYLVRHCHICWSCCLKIQTSGAFSVIFPMSALMLNQYMNSYASSLVFSITMWFRCSCFSAFSCSTAGIIILLPFIAILSMIVIPSVNDQYGYRSFCISALVSGQSWNKRHNNMPMCSLSSIANLISFAFMQFGMSVHDSIALMLMHIPRMSSSLLVLRLCLEIQSAMNSYGPDFYSFPTLYCCILSGILWSLCDMHATSFFKIATPVACDLWSYILHRWSNSGEIFQCHGVCQVLLYQVSTLVKLLLVKSIGCSTALSGASFHGNIIPSLHWRRCAPRPSFHTSVSRYSCYSSL